MQALCQPSLYVPAASELGTLSVADALPFPADLMS